MLLFLDDYNTHSGILDTNTTNASCFRMYRILKDMGIKNNKFFLFLSQPDLQKYDPYDLKDPSVELRQRIAYECKVNPWYYLREVIRVPAPGGDPIHYQFSRANLALNWCFLNSIDSFLTMPRQKGKTIGVVCILSWEEFLAAKNITIGIFAKDDSLRSENIKRIKEIRNSLPEYLVDYKNDTKNQEDVTYRRLKNAVKSFVAQSDTRRAARQGRGETTSSQWWDEMAYYVNNHKSYPSATGACATARKMAFERGIPSANILTTTAGMLNDPAGAYAFHLKSNSARFNECVYDLKDVNAVRTWMRGMGGKTMMYLEYSYKQLGEGDAWLEEMSDGKDAITVAVDYLNEWQLGTGQSIVPIELLNRLNASICEPTEFTTHGGLIVRWYVRRSILMNDENRKRNYLIGLDTSDNVGRDNTTLVISDPLDLSVVATCKCNVTNLVNVASCIAELMNMLPNSILIPERNKNGAFMIDLLIDMMIKKRINPFYRIYNTYFQDGSDGFLDISQIDIGDGTKRKHFGFNTTSSQDSRNILYGRVLITSLQYMANRLFDADLASEIKSLTVRNGRVDHPIGSHDDMVIAWLLTCFFALYGKNHHLYGIPKGEVLKGVNLEGEHVDPEAKSRQLKIRERIGELKGLILGTSNAMVKTSYERELRHLESLVDDKLIDDNLISADQVKQQASKAQQFTPFDFRKLKEYF